MPGKRGVLVLGVALALACSGALWLLAADKPTPQARRAAPTRAYQAGNFKDAYDGLRKLALDPNNDKGEVGKDLDLAVVCLQRLGRVEEIDDFREAVVALHKGNWRLLEAAALNVARTEHYGYLVAGKFYRGHKRGGGRYVSAMHRDRVRALQLLQQARQLTAREADKPALAQLHRDYANVVLNGAGWYEAWRLQSLTDLATLPDYEEGPSWYRGSARGAPVDEAGKPVYYRVPTSFETAANDGERWRWLLAQAVEFSPGSASEVDLILATFFRQQLGVQTMAHHGYRRDAPGDQSGTFALHTLKDTETIARLATGVQRFALPDEFNWVKIYRRVAGRGKCASGEQARDALAQEYEDRRQYAPAAAAWKKAIAEYGPGAYRQRPKRLAQIVDNWGRFEPGHDQAAGTKARLDFRFRNATRVAFEAFPIHVGKLLDDVKAYLKSNPPELNDWHKYNISNIGYRLVERNEQQYLGPRAASWGLDLKPRPNHVDDRLTVDAPLDKPGAYLVTARVAGGNLSRIVVWLSDTAIVKKQLDGRAYYFVADAVTGKPVPKARVEFFGWKQTYLGVNKPRYKVETLTSTRESDADGQLILGQGDQPINHQWLLTARKAKDGLGGADRFAYLGFTGVWYGRAYDPEYNQTRVFAITDRPVYRPEQKVQFKAWVRHAKYDQADTSSFANQGFTVRLHDPRGEKVLEKAFTTDAYGGLAGEWALPRDAVLGQYHLAVWQGAHGYGGGHFRVEEYKKPEFEVLVEAPKEPVRLGEKVTATIKARYYFGSPVTQARVKYKVLRTSYSNNWYPAGRWDWFYGSGYWWFASDYAWYPGWGEWGCKRPRFAWWGRWNREQPEVVLENEVAIGPDGTVQVVLDTAAAKELHGDQDHQYALTAEVADESRRAIVGTGNVLVARQPFKIFSWVDRGHYLTGDTVQAGFRAQTLDRKPVEGKGELTLYRVGYNARNEPVEKAVETWKVDTNAEGVASQKLKASRPGQYRLALKLTDSRKHTIEGGYVFVVRGKGFDGAGFRFNDLELITDKREYAPGDKVKVLINAEQVDGTVLLFVRPTSGVYLAPRVLRLKGKSVVEEVAVVQKDMPNFFLEAVTVAGGRVHAEVREVVVPPEKRVLTVEVEPSQAEYKPGQKATVKVRVSDLAGKPFVGSAVLSVYDRSVDYVAGGSNVPGIKEFFWKWRRHHSPSTESSLGHWFGNLVRSNEVGMADLGVFGAAVVEDLVDRERKGVKGRALREQEFTGRSGGGGDPRTRLANAKKPGLADGDEALPAERKGEGAAPAGGGPAEPTVRKNFADTAFWAAALTTNANGVAEVAFPMPENLTGWKIKAWALGHGTKVGEGSAEVVTRKDLIVRLQAPRFFVEKDEVVLSANVHNYLKSEKSVKVTLEVGGGTLALTGSALQTVSVPAGGEKRVDWRVKVKAEGQATVRMKAVSDEESDAVEMRFPSYVHGMLKMDSFSGVVRPEASSAALTMTVPKERRVNESRLEVRYSPTLAGAMVDALPYLVDYPYGCTEQTLNRFLPTVITQRILQGMKLDLKDVEKKRTNLNAAELGDARGRAKGWKRFERNAVFDEDEVKRMSAAGVARLTAMQCGDGGWGWFSGHGEYSWPHTTAVVVHGLQLAKQNDVQLGANVLERGVAWLKGYQEEQIRWLQNAPAKTLPWKDKADNLDALVHMVLVDAGVSSPPMRDFLYRDRTNLAAYAKAMYGLALHQEKQGDKLAMVLKNIEQFVEEDKENQTAYLRLPASNPWWYWYGSEVEANAYYLKLLSRTSPRDKKAAGLVKYLLNNRKHSTFWNSTRDTAVCVEAMAEYLKASGEGKPDLTVEVWLDGKKHKEVKIDAGNLFTFDNRLVLTGDAVTSGKHTVEVKKKGTGPVYFNAYLSNFTLEDFITRAGLEVKVNRKYYKLTRVDATVKAPGARGQAADRKVEKYKRTELANGATLKSGELVEIELELDSKNDYEYLLFEDPKAAGFEPLLVRSGYNPNDLGAYMELRDDRVCFFVRALARGKHSVSYRMRAEVPGKFSALPARASAMYAPELKGNSDEIKLAIED